MDYTQPEAKVIADSVSPEGFRITTIQETFWRPVLAERNTHKIQPKNSASLRAIPLEKLLARFEEFPSMPVSWPAEQPGMQGGAELEGEDLIDAMSLWFGTQKKIAKRIRKYIEKHPDKSTRLHKSVINRLLETGLWHTACTTATAWENYFDQRCHEDAQPELRAVALLAKEAYDNSTPKVLATGEWHLPYVDETDWEDINYLAETSSESRHSLAAKISAARVARTSYETQEGKRDVREDLGLYDKLVTLRVAAGLPIHWSPLEQVATPDGNNIQSSNYEFTDLNGDRQLFPTNHLPRVGPLTGWRTLRHEVEAAHDVLTYK